MSNHITKLVPHAMRVQLAVFCRDFMRGLTATYQRPALFTLFLGVGIAFLVSVALDARESLTWGLFGTSQGLFAALMLDVLLGVRHSLVDEQQKLLRDQRSLLRTQQDSNEEATALARDLNADLREANGRGARFMELLGSGLIHYRRFIADGTEDNAEALTLWSAEVEHEFTKLAERHGVEDELLSVADDYGIELALTPEQKAERDRWQASLANIAAEHPVKAWTTSPENMGKNWDGSELAEGEA